MHVQYNAEVKKLNECAHADYVVASTVRGRFEGLCILNEEGTHHLLVLDSDDTSYRFRIMKQNHIDEVISYGNDWCIAPKDMTERPNEVFNFTGGFLHTSDGMFIIGREFGGFEDSALCRLDKAAVWRLAARPDGGVGYRNWCITMREPHTDEVKELATKNDPVPDAS